MQDRPLPLDPFVGRAAELARVAEVVCVLGTMALSAGQLAEAQRHLSQALTQARDAPDSGPLAALIASRLAGTHILLGDGDEVQALARWALGTGSLGATAISQTRTLVAIGASQSAGPRAALAELEHLDADPARVRAYAVLWRPLLAEGLIGSGQAQRASAVLAQVRAVGSEVGYLQQALAWLEGWLAERRGDPEHARRIYQRGEDAAGPHSPVHTARLLLAHGQLLRRMGQRRPAVERLRRANEEYQMLRATPFITRTEEELAACNLPADPARKQPGLALTSRETEVAHLVGKGMSNPEIAAELFISRKAVEYHLGNIYAKCGLQGRQQLRHFVGQWRQPATV